MPYSNTSPMTPQEIVQELDKHIIGQRDAKRAVANALRNRWRRTQLPAELRAEIKPKNILMIGPTGVGKTEIARRLAKINNAPFLKIEATKFTEVGYVGRDVDSIIRDLVDAAIKDAREQAIVKMRHKAEEAAEERILDVLIPKHSHDEFERDESKLKEESAARQAFRKLLREKQLEDKEIEIDISSTIGVEIMAPPGMEEMTQQLQNMLQNMASEKKRKRKMKIKDAYKLLTDEEASKLIDEDEIKRQALYNVEQNGIVFIDEIDKITRRAEYSGSSDISREGVQRDLLPLIEGSTISTKYGMIKTDHILFIASGAFQLTKPSDLIPELQGRLPIRVELLPLSVEDFVSILIEPNASLTEQYIALLSTEEVTITFTESGIRRLAEIAWHVNERTENIGARRLHTVMEKLLENISYTANEQRGHKVDIDAAYVNGQLEKLVQNEDLSQYIL